MSFVRVMLICAFFVRSAATDQVDRLFGYGADRNREQQALDLLVHALSNTPDDYELLWRAARSYYYVGDGAAKDRVMYFQRGINAGLQAVAKNPNGVEGHFWLGASYGGYCRDKGGIAAFRDVKKVRAEMEIVLRLDERYEEGSAYTALGEIDRQLPRLFGGSLKRSIAYLEQGIKVAPASPEIRYSLAEAYRDADRKNDMRIQLKQALELPPSSIRTNESRRAHEKAQKLLAKLASIDAK